MRTTLISELITENSKTSTLSNAIRTIKRSTRRGQKVAAARYLVRKSIDRLKKIIRIRLKQKKMADTPYKRLKKLQGILRNG